jgi:SOS response regulatory protein OraA/RecX
MSKRLQVILDEEEMRALQDIAKRHHTTVAEWVRQALRAARRQEPRVDAERKLKVIRAAVRHKFPSGDIQQMLAEIERGYLANDSL